jgi:hypothetical protein
MVTIHASLRNSYEFACHSSACAPPPAGTGGSKGGSGKGGGGGSTLINASKAVANRSGNGGAANARAFLKSKSQSPTQADGGGGAASIRGGKVSINGEAVTGKVTNTNPRNTSGGMWQAKLLSKYSKNSLSNTVQGKTKAELAAKVKKAIEEDAAKGRQSASGVSSKLVSGTPAANRARGISASNMEKFSKIGPTKPADVKIGRDGVAKVKGVEVGKVSRGSDNKWRIEGKDKQSGRGGMEPRTWKTQAAAKAELARDVNAAVKLASE